MLADWVVIEGITKILKEFWEVWIGVNWWPWDWLGVVLG